MEQLRDVESELEIEQRRAREMAAHNRKIDRCLQELRLSSEEDKRQVVELSDSVQVLTIKVKTLRRQLEEAVRSFTHFKVFNDNGTDLRQTSHPEYDRRSTAPAYNYGRFLDKHNFNSPYAR